MKKNGFYLRAMAAFLLAGFAASLQAAGFALFEQSASGVGHAFAGASVAAEDASTVYYNPAGLTRLQGSQLVLSGHAIHTGVEFSNHGSSSLNGMLPLSGNDGQQAGDWFLVPSFYYARDIGERLKFGLGVNTPYVLKTEYDSAWVGRYDAIKSEVKTVNINPAFAYQVNDRLSIGAGISAQYISAELTNAIDYGSTCAIFSADQQLAPFLAGCAAPQAHDGHLKLTGSDWSWGYNLGVLFEPSADTRIGLAYRSRIRHELEGDARFSAAPAALGIVPGFAAAVADGSIKADLTLPETASVGIMQQLGSRWTLMGDVTWTRWSRFKELRVERRNGDLIGVTPEHWHNTRRYALGLSYQYSPQLKLRAGLAYDESPVPDGYRTPRIPDEDRRIVALGASYQFNANDLIDIGFAHFFVKKAGLDLETPVVGAVPQVTRNLRGDYDISATFFSLQYTHHF